LVIEEIMKLAIERVIKNWKFAKDIIIENKPFIVNNVSNGRRFKIQDTANHWSEAFNEFKLTPQIVEPMLKNFIGNHYLDGAAVQEHTDPAPDGFVHTRCNLMLKKPSKGGNPIIDGEEIEVNENDLWLCLASLEKHYTTPIEGGERLVFSFGALVPIDQIKRIIL
jgi:hypothetical protein